MKLTEKDWRDILEAVETSNIFHDREYKNHLAEVLSKYVEEESKK